MTKSDLLPGLLPGMVFLTDPAPGWARLYDQEAARIAKALGPVVVAIEHYGSTSIPGIKAKPVIDLLVGLPRLDDALAQIGAMERLGYTPPTPAFPAIMSSERARPAPIWPTLWSIRAKAGSNACVSATGCAPTPNSPWPMSG